MKDSVLQFIENVIQMMFESFTQMGWLTSELNGVANMVGVTVSGSFFGTMKAVGCMLLLCMFYIHLLESALKDRGDPDSLIKEIAMLGVYGIVILNLDSILPTLTNVIDGIRQLAASANIIDVSAGDGLAGQDGALDTLKGSFDASRNIIALLLDAFLYAVFGNLVLIVVQCICSITVITIKFELVIRTALMPLAVGFIAEDGWKGPGGRFIKKWCACLCQTVIISLAFKAYAAVNYMAIGDGGGSFFVSLICGGFALAGICTKSGQLANDVMGV